MSALLLGLVMIFIGAALLGDFSSFQAAAGAFASAIGGFLIGFNRGKSE